MSSTGENQTALESEAMRALRKHEKGCKKRHKDIQRQFRSTNKGVRNWAVGSVIFLTLIMAIMSVSLIIVMNYLSRPVTPANAEQKIIVVDPQGKILDSVK